MWTRCLAVVLSFSMLSGCALFRKKHPLVRVDGPKMVGTVTLVNDEMHFVLIDVGTLYTPPKGQALKSFAGETETGVLAVSGEKRQPFIAADIVRGTPHTGDIVMQ